MLVEFLTKFFTLLLGYAVPAYECFKSIVQLPRQIDEFRFWLKYWIVVSLLFIFDEIADDLTLSIPMYCELKLAFLLCLWYPRTRHECNIKGRLLQLHANSNRIVIHALFRVKKFTEKGRDFCLKLRDYVPSQASAGRRAYVPLENPHADFPVQPVEDPHADFPMETAEVYPVWHKVTRHPEYSHQPRLQEALQIHESVKEDKEVLGRKKRKKVLHDSMISVEDFLRDQHEFREWERKRERKWERKLEREAQRKLEREAQRKWERELERVAQQILAHQRRSQSRHLCRMCTYENIVHDFMESHDLVLGILGMRGVGKSALLRIVRDSYADNTSFDHVLLVGAGTVNNVQHAIVTSLGLDLPMMSSLDEQSQLRAVIFHYLEHKSFLLLLDDVGEPIDMWDVGLPLFSRRGQKIIYATRSRAVCAEMLHGAGKTFEICRLGEDDAWNLFKEKVGPGIIDDHPQVHQLAKKIVAECRGLPLALCIIGRAMSSKTDAREWRNAYNLLKDKNSKTQEDEGYSCLDILENELKDSFLVTSLWPKDGSIPKERSMPVMDMERGRQLLG